MVSPKNEKEQATLVEFQKRVSDLDYDEYTCLRFLFAREFDINLAEKMIRNNSAWRKEVDINYLAKEWEVPQNIQEDFKLTIMGESYKGNPVVYVPGGQWNLRCLIEQGELENIMKFTLKNMENFLIRTKELGNKQVVALYDFEGLTYYKVSSWESNKMIYNSLLILDQNYPELLGTVIIFNAPYPFYIAWNMIKPFLSERTLNKFQVFGNDKTKYLQAIREICADDVIPEKYLH